MKAGDVMTQIAFGDALPPAPLSTPRLKQLRKELEDYESEETRLEEKIESLEQELQYVGEDLESVQDQMKRLGKEIEEIETNPGPDELFPWPPYGMTLAPQLTGFAEREMQ